MAKLGVQSTFVLTATKDGNPGSFEGAPTVEIVPAEIATAVTIADDNQSFKVDWASAGDCAINVTVDNLGGIEAVGALSGSVAVSVANADPEVLADTLTVAEQV